MYFFHQVLPALLQGDGYGPRFTDDDNDGDRHLLSTCHRPGPQGGIDSGFGHFTAESEGAFEVSAPLLFYSQENEAQRRKVIGLYDLVEETRTQTACLSAMGPFHHPQASSPALFSGKLNELSI